MKESIKKPIKYQKKKTNQKKPLTKKTGNCREKLRNLLCGEILGKVIRMQSLKVLEKI